MTEITPESLALQIKTASDETKRIAEAAMAETKSLGTATAETKEAADKALVELTGLRGQLSDIEQKMARKPADDTQVKSFGAQFAESEAYKAFDGDANTKMRVQFKTVTSAAAGTAWSARENAITGMPYQPLRVRDLLTVIPTSGGSVDFVKQTTRTNAAAPVAEGAAKPYSDYAYTLTNVPVRVIAHLAKITRQALEDAAQLQGEIDAEMRYGLKLAEDAQLLNGNGTGQNLSGLVTNSTAYALPTGGVTPTTDIDQLRLALLQVELADYGADGMVLHPTSWANIELTKDTNGRYIWANPMNLGGPRLWGLPVVSTRQLASGKFLVGNFAAQVLYDRMAPEVLISSENSDDFEKNLYTMRCEERVALAVKRGAALVYGTLI